MKQRRTARLIILGLALASVLGAGALSLPSSASALPLADPNASLSVSPNPALRGQTVTFDGSASTGDESIPASFITKYEFDLDGDGVFEVEQDETDPTVTHSYTSLATLTVRLQVTDNEGDTDVDTKSLQIVNAAPTASFIFEPSTPAVNEPIVFSSTSSDPDGTIPDGNHKWDFNNDDVFGDAIGRNPTHSFSSAGTKPVSVQVTDTDGATVVATRNVLVQANPPNATFTFAPAAPLSGQTVSFDASASTPPAGETITARSWDLDGDNQFDDATGPTATASYPTPGNRTIGLLVESSGGGFDITTRTVPVSNRDPVASMVFVPQSPTAGDTVRLTSTAADPDGPIVEQTWDLDGDGEFDDAAGPTADKLFGEPGAYNVGLRVRDANGATDTEVAAISVAPKPLELMSPFPVVRLSGELKQNGNTKVERLSVRASSGTDVAVVCRHKDCPFKEKERAIKVVRVGFPAIERSLKPGVVIKVFVTDPGAIGKYTRFRIRNDKAPKRTDNCLEGENRDPFRCPRS